MSDAASLALGLLTDPRVGLGILVLLAAVVLWVAAWPRRQPRRIGWEPPARAPDRDPVSRTYLALEDGRYSEVLRETYDRLDAALFARTGRSLAEIPWTDGAARRARIPAARALRRTRDSLGTLELWSERLESDSPFRWDFWRSLAESRQRFRRRLSTVFAAVDRHLAQLEKRA